MVRSILLVLLIALCGVARADELVYLLTLHPTTQQHPYGFPLVVGVYAHRDDCERERVHREAIEAERRAHTEQYNHAPAKTIGEQEALDYLRVLAEHYTVHCDPEPVKP